MQSVLLIKFDTMELKFEIRFNLKFSGVWEGGGGWKNKANSMHLANKLI